MDITTTTNSAIGKINNNRKKSEVLNILENAEIQRKSYEKNISSSSSSSSVGPNVGSIIIHDGQSTNVIIEHQKTPKKVSFSDELPVISTSTTIKSSEPVQIIYNESNPPKYNESADVCVVNQFPSPIEYAIQKTKNYMKFLHGEQSTTSGMEICESKNNYITNNNNNIKSKKSSSDNIYYIDDIANTTNTTINSSDENSNCSVCSTNNDKNIETIKHFETTNNSTTTAARHQMKNVDENYASLMEIEVKRDKKRWLLISECSALLGDERHTSEQFFKIFSNKVFLDNLFKLFDIESIGVLTQDKWIEHLKGRLTEEKQIDFAEQIESVAYVLCGEEPITFDKFCQIWNAKGILDKLYRLIDIELTNLISTNQVMEFISNLTNARSRSGFDRTAIQRLEQLFLLTVGNEKEIRLDDFKKIVTSKNPFFTDRVFQIFDKDNSGSISLQEFIDAIHQFAGQSPEDKIKFLFKVYDIDGDGLIQHRELQHVMRACMEENGMRFSEDQIEDLTMAMFEDADPFNRGAITYESLKAQLEKHGGLLENLSISIDRWLVPLPVESKKTRSALVDRLPHQFTTPYLRNNYVFLVFLTIYFVINAGLFISRCIQYKSVNGFVILARACGQCLNFNCAFVLVLMLRKCITFLRTRGYGGFLPLDNHIYMHKLAGTLIAIYSLIHTIMHLFNFSLVVMSDPIINANNYTLSEWMFTTKPKLFGLWAGCANPTGFALAAILLIMFVCSLPFVRRTGRFEIFYYTHLLYVPFWILVIFHGPNFWKWFIGPLFVFLIERTVKFIWMRSGRGKTYISSGLLLPSKVTHLVIKRPVHFYFRPGDYVFVNIPAIAKYEWHPFTLSSAPEQEEYMWLHVRGVGEWTNRLYSYFEREQQRLHNGEIFPLIPNHQKFKTTSINIEGGSSSPQSKSSINVHKDSKNSNFESTNLADNVFDNEKNNDISKQQKPFSYDIHHQGTSKTASTSDNFTTPPANRSKLLERQISENTTIKKIQATLHRTFSRKSNMSTSSDPVATKGYLNDAYLSDGTHNENANTLTAGQHKISTEKKFNMLLFKNRAPLEKSLSMPDMENRLKKRERLMALREYTRSESERSFDEVQIKNARLQSLGLAYLSPQNKSLAQSFRYMRNKPTIIAFKTPSLENCDQRLSQNSIGSIIVSPGVYSQKLNNEEERTYKITNTVGIHTGEGKVQRSVNYPVGKPLEVYIDGPYGAPASHIFSAQHAILIATGIGVTPFASILQSIMHRYWKARHTCPRCDFEWSSEIPHTVMNLRKVDFFWINRDQRSFEWFVNLLSQLEIEQAELGGAMERFLDMHMYITSALQKTDMKAVGLQLALDLLHQKEKRDLITGLKTRTNAGRPNWDKVFKQLQDQKKGKVTVFYCGPPQLGKTLRIKCDQFGFDFRKEIF